jgi:DNA-directed RNA polymerase subunit RPC12/RpoP
MIMTTINEIFKTHAPEYIRRFGDHMPKLHLKAINAIKSCRTSACGLLMYRCTRCGTSHKMYRSCGNRHCPVCQNHKMRQWLQGQLQRQLPGHHFMITFTVPQQLRRFIRSNPKKAYSALFAASADTLKAVAQNRRFIGGDLPGFFGVLHTWGRQLQYHPHIHYIVPGGAVSKSDTTWHPSPVNFFAPVKGMSTIFKAKLRDEFTRIGLIDTIAPHLWQQDFIVNCQAVGNCQESIRYLAPYVFKVAIANSRIIKVEDGKVFFRYKKPRSNRWRIMALDIIKFMRRYLQHVLPTGFMKVRYYGFMSPASSVALEKVRSLIELAYGFDVAVPEFDQQEDAYPTCPYCGGKLEFRCWMHPLIARIAEYG